MTARLTFPAESDQILPIGKMQTYHHKGS